MIFFSHISWILSLNVQNFSDNNIQKHPWFLSSIIFWGHFFFNYFFHFLQYNHKHILTACQDRNVRVYTVGNGKHIKTFKGSNGKFEITTNNEYYRFKMNNIVIILYDFFICRRESFSFLLKIYWKIFKVLWLHTRSPISHCQKVNTKKAML